MSARRHAIQLIILFLTGVIVVWLLRIVIKQGGRRRVAARREATPQNAPGTPCPLCGTRLTRGQRVQSVVYPGKTERLMEIFGCPNCHPRSGPAKTFRICPVCRQKLEETDYVVARMFERAGERKHVHVLGCTRCRKGA